MNKLLATSTVTAIALVGTQAWAQTYDFYASKEGPKKPTLVFVHGGAWVGGTAAQYRSLGEALNARGLCVAIVDYRMAPEFKHPAPVEDLSRAIQQIEASKNEKCRTDRIYLAGHSAGAHMIAFWATQNTDPKIRGFIGLEGIYDIPALVSKWPSYKAQFIASEFGAESNWRAASPTLNKIKHPAPWLVIHSKEDELVDVEQSSAFSKKTGGSRMQLKVLSKGSHFGVVDALKDKYSEAAMALDAFIKKNN